MVFTKISEDDTEPRRWPVSARQVMIDNRDHGNPFKFTVNFEDVHGRYMDVCYAELKAISFPKIAGEAYVVMSIDEIPGNLDAISTKTDQAFAIIFFDSQEMSAGETRAYKGADFYSKKHALKPVKNIDKLHVTFTKYDGATLSASDTGGVVNVSFIIELTCAA